MRATYDQDVSAEHYSIRGCDVYIGPEEHPAEGASLAIAYTGRLGGDQVVTGRIVGAGPLGGGWAGIDSISKRGVFGRWNPKQLTERQVDVLRELGVNGFVLPDGERYEIRDGIPGVRRLTEQD
jgi:hypothetical protein